MSTDDHVPADLPVQRVRADRRRCPAGCGLRRRQPGVARDLGDARPGQPRPGHRPRSAGRCSGARRSSRSSRRSRCAASAGRCDGHPRGHAGDLTAQLPAERSPYSRRRPRAGRERRRRRAAGGTPRPSPGNSVVAEAPGERSRRTPLGCLGAGPAAGGRRRGRDRHPSDGVVDGRLGPSHQALDQPPGLSRPARQPDVDRSATCRTARSAVRAVATATTIQGSSPVDSTPANRTSRRRPIASSTTSGRRDVTSRQRQLRADLHFTALPNVVDG